ncbi:hypothetical protein B0T21DRAFT_353020 [Apiosordaria backusii]|uniref:Uncharacterized protein n=1 Tax=Apiosordaria backusii TaxID=314023 RepID=A0AA40A0Y0_9PEZI|nr:hypothetical protein B0T21DRAFT_353020 [Apiosordaria backusii]
MPSFRVYSLFALVAAVKAYSAAVLPVVHGDEDPVVVTELVEEPLYEVVEIIEHAADPFGHEQKHEVIEIVEIENASPIIEIVDDQVEVLEYYTGHTDWCLQTCQTFCAKYVHGLESDFAFGDSISALEEQGCNFKGCASDCISAFLTCYAISIGLLWKYMSVYLLCHTVGWGKCPGITSLAKQKLFPIPKHDSWPCGSSQLSDGKS